MWVGAPPSYRIRVIFDKGLEPIAPGNLYLPNWRVQMFDHLCQVIGGWVTGTWAYINFTLVTPLVAPDYVSYRKLVPELIGTEHGLPVEAFLRYPIT